MKNFCLLSLILTAPTSAFAVPDLTCAYSGIDKPYQVSFQLKNGTAAVQKNNELARFGNLHCVENNSLYDLIAQCFSQGVWDGGPCWSK